MAPTEKKSTKKEQILSLYMAGAQGIGELAALTGSRPSYVAAVLREAKAIGGYFDLYTTTEQPMNIYSALFAKRLGFRTEGIARRSVRYVDRLYTRFEQLGDRAGQHHALVMALTMLNRARWSNKLAEADIFREWLLAKLPMFNVSQVPARAPQLKHDSQRLPARHRVREKSHALMLQK